MTVVDAKDWRAFRDALYRFSQFDRGSRQKWWFRGQSSFNHELQPSIDRGGSFKSDGEREARIEELLSAYRRELIDVGLGGTLPEGDAFELLARHHGLPSPLLDWTRSPYVAACFAFMGADPSKDPHVAVFAIDRSAVPSSALKPSSSELEFIDDPEYLKLNRRAGQQRSVFIRKSTIRQSVESLLGPALWKFRISATEREAALRDLDQMLLTPTSLMYDLEGAARTVAWRMQGSKG